MQSIRQPVFRALAIAAALLLTSASALAHARPRVMVPAADSTVAAPSAVTVTFSEAVEAKFSSLKVTDERGKRVNKAESTQLARDPKTLTLALPTLQPGAYLVQWVSVAPDGHRMAGEYKFTVK